MFTQILVPLDGSGRAERALIIAARLARASGGSIILVRVVNTEPARLPTAEGRPILIQTVGKADRELAESYLRSVAESDLLRGIPVRTRVVEGLVPSSIMAVAAEQHADIIVINSHGSTGVKHWWMPGSVAGKIARFPTIPVLVLREGGSFPKERHPGEPPLRVLVPLDGSDFAEAALVPAAYLAAYLAAPGRGALHLTHVVQPARASKVPTPATRSAQEEQADQNMARDYLDATVRRLRERPTDPTIADLHLEFTYSVVVDDDIAEGIGRAAESVGNGEGSGMFGGCDAIAMTTHGYSGPQHWMGSVTERVLHLTPFPLLVVRPRE
jgi:nucleotide-binding universal stress UspA family protein